jgi:hypothetical protein
VVMEHASDQIRAHLAEGESDRPRPRIDRDDRPAGE